MSLILEALRKSEAERRRGQLPGVHSLAPSAPPARREDRFPAIGWGLAALVVLLVLWSGVTLLPRAQDAPTIAAPIPDTQSAPRTRGRWSPLPAVAHLSAPVAATPVIATAPSPRRALPAIVPSLQAPAPLTPRFATGAREAVPDEATAGASDDGALRLSDLSPEERKTLPPLKLSMHLWNDTPSRRFVILDGNRRREGDRIGNAVLTAITPDGVVLDWNGRKLKLPIR